MRNVGVSLAAGIMLFGILAGFKKVESTLLINGSTNQDSIQNKITENPLPEVNSELQWANLYDSLKLDQMGLSREAFRYAWFGFNASDFSKPILAIADFSQSSRNKRLYVIDFEAKKLVLNTYVAHGRNSGQEYARQFSNQNSSYQSSLGFYRALTTYQGKHGLSMRLEGLEKNINDQALPRAIVMHGADYVSESFIKQTGRLGRSLGCPAVSNDIHKSLINLLHDGAGLFLYYPDQNYLSKSTILQKALSGTTAQLTSLSQP
jgi:hypothetical protein